MKIMVGGTFDPLHDGHKRLLSRSFQLAGPKGTVIIGLTSDRFASQKVHPVRPYEKRKEELTRFIEESGFQAAWSVEPLEDRFGSALKIDFDALIVSEETLPVAMEINTLRRKEGRRKVDIHQITCVLADDGRWISSTRIYRGEIDPHGRVIG
ncbi:phosphopantetheine adenylyltransferase [Methanosphaerula palustris]|uniref:Phosphopantetheine adenylyltransferase n=1 Tax=Methanosphaerula palustris (strain ATCC BAA-1556 / DSM 19958 / E1-9c) TaxID=521011 RepID=B8GF05_METPE|nr:phosphopantetheine adenylyltransferase [Methanosphaerula palustris]ACL17811.1 cytidyltransferase-related domain protein [Methanosphaerula palustris E1-9c]